MSNNVKVDFDPDPYDNHHLLLEAFFDYLKYHERYCKNPSDFGKRNCRAALYRIQKQTKELRKDFIEVHQTVKQLRQEVFDENRRQREIKKANKGK
jgi:hypothetical protein